MYKIEFYSSEFTYELRNIIHEYSDKFFIQRTEQLNLFPLGQTESTCYQIIILLSNYLEVEELRNKIKIFLQLSNINTDIYYSRLDNDYYNNYNYYQGTMLDNIKSTGGTWK